MKNRRDVPWLLLWCLLAGAAPAYANNPPEPDGVFTLVLIFPVAILGMRLAGARLNDKERKWRLALGGALVLCILLCFAGTTLALLPLLMILAYGISRGIMAMRRGQGRKRLALGAVIILFTFFGIANYLSSASYAPPSAAAGYRVHSVLNMINIAEVSFDAGALPSGNQPAPNRYASLEELHQLRLLDESTWRSIHGPAFKYVLELSGPPGHDAQQYFVYAMPLHYGHSWPTLSIFRNWGSNLPYTTMTYATDESGVVRAADVGSARPVTRAETQSRKAQ